MSLCSTSCLDLCPSRWTSDQQQFGLGESWIFCAVSRNFGLPLVVLVSYSCSLPCDTQEVGRERVQPADSYSVYYSRSQQLAAVAPGAAGKPKMRTIFGGGRETLPLPPDVFTILSKNNTAEGDGWPRLRSLQLSGRRLILLSRAARLF